MPIVDSMKRAFSQDNIDKSPDRPGVYALFDGDVLIYYGRAQVSIRDRLQSHFDGNEGRCTQNATSYMREETSRPVSREVELLEEYDDAFGKLPRCNERIG